MATKQTTQLCYQVNGGTCRNKVSAKNYYVCAAGHGISLEASFSQITSNSTSKLAASTRLNLASARSITHGIAQTLFRDGDDYVKRELAKNPSIDRDIAQALFETEDLYTRCNLASNPSIDRDIQQALFETENWTIRENLTTNPSIDRDIAQALFETENWTIRENLAMNPSIDRDIAIELTKEGHSPSGYLKNKSINELCKLDNLSLIDQFPKVFSQIYLSSLMYVKTQEEATVRALIVYSYNAYQKSNNIRGGYDYYRERILERYSGDEEIKILLSQDS